MRLSSTSLLAVGLAVATSAAIACSSGSSGSSGSPDSTAESAPEFPKLADYDTSCVVDSDCSLVRGEGCASCDVAALSSTAVAAYEAAYASSQRSGRCQDLISRAAPCVREGQFVARCSSSRCAAVALVTDAGPDGSASDGSASDAASD